MPLCTSTSPTQALGNLSMYSMTFTLAARPVHGPCNLGKPGCTDGNTAVVAGPTTLHSTWPQHAWEMHQFRVPACTHTPPPPIVLLGTKRKRGRDEQGKKRRHRKKEGYTGPKHRAGRKVQERRQRAALAAHPPLQPFREGVIPPPAPPPSPRLPRGWGELPCDILMGIIGAGCQGKNDGFKIMCAMAPVNKAWREATGNKEAARRRVARLRAQRDRARRHQARRGEKNRWVNGLRALKGAQGRQGVGFRSVAKNFGLTQAGLRRLDARMQEDGYYREERWWEGMHDSGVITAGESPSEGSGVDFDLL